MPVLRVIESHFDVGTLTRTDKCSRVLLTSVFGQKQHKRTVCVCVCVHKEKGRESE